MSDSSTMPEPTPPVDATPPTSLPPESAPPVPPVGSEMAASDVTPAAAPAPVASPPPTPAPAPPPPPPAPGSAPVAPGQGPAEGLRYAVDIVFCIDVSGSMTPILDQVKANALRFYDDVQRNLTDKGKNVDELRVRAIAFRDLKADGAGAVRESPFFPLPSDQAGFSDFVNGLVPEGGGDAPESGLEAVAVAVNSPWTTTGDRRRQVIVVWTDAPAQPLDPSVVPTELADRVPKDFSDLTDLWENPQGGMGANSKRLILFAPDGPGWSDISGVWENVVHHPSQAGGGLSDVDYGTIVDSIANSV